MIPFWRKKHQEEPDKITFTVKNGEILLEKFITTFDGKRNPIRNFSCEELELATNNYDTVNITMIEVYFKFYKGFLQDRQISVLKFKSNEEYAYDECINNIVFASQMCHRHILKLIGCCIETRVPILVFESPVKYGTLRDHIHKHHEPHFESLSWKQRLKITTEIANTFSYLHVGFAKPIVYSNMNLSHFLLEEHYVPKLFDFSFAECIPKGETQIKEAQIRGTMGNMAPEHVMKSVLDEKCDVFGFGLLLLELLTGQSWLNGFLNSFAKKYGDSSETEDEDIKCSSGTEDHHWLWNFVKKINEDNWFVEVVDPIIVGEGLCPEIEQQMKVFAKLAVKCLFESGEDRPTMIDVAKQLRQLYLSAP
ncbi:hypothetical protein LWI29_032565 [Acer saccharum]|uniref:Protein kinase domain-containing protein n=1 Tax=Acer saccharum TaxID=4024 RepID=A0AA39T8D0_ACESA|nr:hypothetical protein LWI29_032565 [Acer saccharum]